MQAVIISHNSEQYLHTWYTWYMYTWYTCVCAVYVKYEKTVPRKNDNDYEKYWSILWNVINESVLYKKKCFFFLYNVQNNYSFREMDKNDHPCCVKKCIFHNIDTLTAANARHNNIIIYNGWIVRQLIFRPKRGVRSLVRLDELKKKIMRFQWIDNY